MVKLRFYIARRSLWAVDAERLRLLCEPHVGYMLEGGLVRIQLRVSTSMRNPVRQLNKALSSTKVAADFRLVRADGTDGDEIEDPGSVYVYIRGLTLTELVG
jgi:hypothetical protein